MMEVNPNKAKDIRKLNEVDIQEAKEKIKCLADAMWDRPEYFDINPNKHKHGPIDQAEHIIFYFSTKSKGQFEYSQLPIWDEWKSVLMPIMEEGTKAFEYTNGFYPRVMLAKLPAQKFIKSHTDGNHQEVAPHKIHIPILTNPSSFFFLNNKPYHFEEGMAYEVNNGEPHSVVNGGDSDRIHLIFEYVNLDCQLPIIKNKMLALKQGS